MTPQSDHAESFRNLLARVSSTTRRIIEAAAFVVALLALAAAVLGYQLKKRLDDPEQDDERTQ